MFILYRINLFCIVLACAVGINTSFVCAADDADSLKSTLPTAQENQTPLVIASDEDIFNIYLKKHEDILPECKARLHAIIDEIWPLQISAAQHGGQSVHLLDAMVGRQLANLLDITKKLELGKCLPLPEALVIAREVNYMKDVFEKVEAVHIPHYVTPAYLERVCDGFNQKDIELFSLSVTLSHELKAKYVVNHGVSTFATIEDNITTGGGCLPGRRNRLFVALASTMASMGV